MNPDDYEHLEKAYVACLEARDKAWNEIEELRGEIRAKDERIAALADALEIAATDLWDAPLITQSKRARKALNEGAAK